jgi:hypothetical protein
MRAELAMALHCPECGAELAARGLNESQQIACCTRCGKVLDLARPRRATPEVESAPRSEIAPAPVRLPKPDHMTVVEDQHRVTVTWKRPMRERVGPLLNLTLAAVFCFYVLLDVAAAPALLALLSCGWLYASAALLWNRTRVRATRELLEIDVGPLPWFGAHRLAREDVRQLFAEVRLVPDKNGQAELASYVVSGVIGPEQRRVELVTELAQPDDALWLEETLEHALGLRHTAVGGELES